MLEPEAAYAHLEDMIELGEGLVGAVVQSVVKNRARELVTLNRDIAKLEKIVPPFPESPTKMPFRFCRRPGTRRNGVTISAAMRRP